VSNPRQLTGAEDEALATNARLMLKELENGERELRELALELVEARRDEKRRRDEYAQRQDDAFEAFDTWERAESHLGLATIEFNALLGRMRRIYENVKGQIIDPRALDPLTLASNLVGNLQRMVDGGRL
jgi:hypothetical protein